VYIKKREDHQNQVELQYLGVIFYLIIQSKKKPLATKRILHVNNNRPPVSIKTAFGGSRYTVTAKNKKIIKELTIQIEISYQQ
jgi:hypothetical protein